LTPAPTERLARLRQNLADYFNDSELHDVCFDLGVSYDDLAGPSKADKARELVSYLERRGRIGELVGVCSRLRPNVGWGDALTEASETQASPGESPEPPRSGHVSATFFGNISGQVAVGNVIVSQSQTLGTAQPTLVETNLAGLRQLLADLEAQVAATAPSEQRQAAVERVRELGEAITAKEPDLSTLEYVQRWFVKNLPGLAGTVTGVVTHPIVSRLVEAAGDALAADFRRRFGSRSA